MTALSPIPPVGLLLLYLLLSVRFLGMLFTAPLLSGASLPMSVRFWMAFVLAVLALPGGDRLPDMLEVSSVSGMLLASGRELLVGSLLGFLAGAPLYVLQMAGRLIGMQMSFEMASVLDPFSQTQVSVVEQFHFVVGMWFFFLWNGHLLVIQGVVESVHLLPIGHTALFPTGDPGLGPWIRDVTVAAMRIVLPFLGALLLADVGLGFVARTVPQMNIFVLGLPLKAGLGFFLIMVVLPMAVEMAHSMVDWALAEALRGIVVWR